MILPGLSQGSDLLWICLLLVSVLTAVSLTHEPRIRYSINLNMTRSIIQLRRILSPETGYQTRSICTCKQPSVAYPKYAKRRHLVTVSSRTVVVMAMRAAGGCRRWLRRACSRRGGYSCRHR
ncbi:hypothetical protein BJX66DRAFT_307103 [Aspergillus keveii]|uniref:Secreted protein n=1 Tax=Aspergillus keveii TaxID=714993 RepID=A0ABR4G194_9EURO